LVDSASMLISNGSITFTETDAG